MRAYTRLSFDSAWLENTPSDSTPVKDGEEDLRVHLSKAKHVWKKTAE